MSWRKDTRAVIRAYPELRRQEAALHEMSTTPGYASQPGAHAATRTTETAALRQLPPGDQRALDAVATAIQTTMRYRNGALRIRIIDLVYWQRRTPSRARRWPAA